MNGHLCRPLAAAAVVLAAATACTDLSSTQGASEVHALVAARAPGLEARTPAAETQAAIDARVAKILMAPLSVDGAVSVALLRNPRLQIEFARLGLAAADVLAASRISNPTLAASLLEPISGPDAALGNGALTQSLADLLLLHVRKRWAAGEYRRAEALVANAILDLAVDVHAAWYRYLGALQVAELRARMVAGAQTSADLAAQFLTAGNISRLQFTQEQSAATLARLAAARARADAVRARDELTELLGLERSEDHWTTGDRLEAPVAHEDPVAALLDLAHAQRLDLLAAREELSVREQASSATQRYRWLGATDIGVAGERDTNRSRLVGPTLSLQLPIFNQGQASVARAAALLAEQRGSVRALELGIDAAVRQGAERVAAAHEIADEYRTALIPERDEVLAQTQAAANYMLIGTFELLLAKQAQYDADQGYVEAVRDYWLARVDLMRAVGARLPSDLNVTGERR